jgi:branched-chain amino acid transport system ATP-binding protein
MALRVSQRAYALATGSVALAGMSADLLTDERVKHLYLGGQIERDLTR